MNRLNQTRCVETQGEFVVRRFVIEVIDVYEAPFDFNATALVVSEDAPIDSLVGNFYQTQWR